MPKNSSYSTELDMKNLLRIRELLKELPICISDFISARSVNSTTRTQLAYVYDLRTFFVWWKSAVPELNDRSLSSITTDDIANITARDIEEYMVHLQTTAQQPNKKVSISRKLSALSSLFQYLYRHDDIPADPCAKVERPKVTRDKRIVRLTDFEARQLLDVIENGSDQFSEKQQKYLLHTRVRDMAIVVLLLDTGIRVSECVGLNLEDVNLQAQTLQVYRKGGKFQFLPFNTEVAEALSAYLTVREKLVPASRNDENAFFLSLQNKRMTKDAIELMITKYARAIGLRKNITPHKLRKTYGTTLYNNTRDILLVANALGHDNVATTTDHYVTDDEDNLKRVVDAVRFRPSDEDDS